MSRVLFVVMMLLANPAFAQDNAPLNYSGLFIKMVVLLAVIIVLGFVLMRYVGRGSQLRGKGAGQHFELLSWFRLNPKNTLYVVRIGKRHFALGSGDGQVNVISEIDADDLET